MADGSGIATSEVGAVGGGGGGAMDIGGMVAAGVQDFMRASSLKDQERLYKEEASMYGEAANVEKSATNIQEFQVQRQATKAIGGEKAAVAASGFADSGSSLNIMRESAQQANIAKTVVEQQGVIKEQSDLEQQDAATAAARAASKAAVGADIAGGIDAIATVAAAVA